MLWKPWSRQEWNLDRVLPPHLADRPQQPVVMSTSKSLKSSDLKTLLMWNFHTHLIRVPLSQARNQIWRSCLGSSPPTFPPTDPQEGRQRRSSERSFQRESAKLAKLFGENLAISRTRANATSGGMVDFSRRIGFLRTQNRVFKRAIRNQKFT